MRNNLEIFADAVEYVAKNKVNFLFTEPSNSLFFWNPTEKEAKIYLNNLRRIKKQESKLRKIKFLLLKFTRKLLS